MGGPPEVRCALADPRITESSGVAAASWSDDVVFTHNDSGDGARFFAVDARSCATRAAHTVRGAANLDWEDMARGAAPDGTPVLWLADIGDNRARRRSVVVYEVAEPGPSAAGGTVAVRSRWTLTYPDGAHDAETVLVDPETRRPVVVTKDSTGGRSRAYRVPPAGSGVLEPVADLDVRALEGGGLVGLAGALTAGATSPDRTTVVLRSYLSAWAWAASPGEALGTVLARPPQRLELPVGRQSEALSFTRDGRALWATSEGAGSPLTLVPLDPASPAPPAAAPVGPPPPPTATGPPSGSSRRTKLLGAGAVVLAGTFLTISALVRRRRPS